MIIFEKIFFSNRSFTAKRTDLNFLFLFSNSHLYLAHLHDFMSIRFVEFSRSRLMHTTIVNPLNVSNDETEDRFDLIWLEANPFWSCRLLSERRQREPLISLRPACQRGPLCLRPSRRLRLHHHRLLPCPNMAWIQIGQTPFPARSAPRSPRGVLPFACSPSVGGPHGGSQLVVGPPPPPPKARSRSSAGPPRHSAFAVQRNCSPQNEKWINYSPFYLAIVGWYFAKL